jgi:hypothetical protein
MSALIEDYGIIGNTYTAALGLLVESTRLNRSRRVTLASHPSNFSESSWLRCSPVMSSAFERD